MRADLASPRQSKNVQNSLQCSPRCFLHPGNSFFCPLRLVDFQQGTVGGGIDVHAQQEFSRFVLSWI